MDRFPICQDAQDREQLGPTLHFIDDDQALERSEREHGDRKASTVLGPLQVEVMHAAAPLSSQSGCESRLPDLPWPEDRNDRVGREVLR